MGKLSRVLAVAGSLGVLAAPLVGAAERAQAASAGGTVGNIDKSASGGGEGAAAAPRAKSRAATRSSAQSRPDTPTGAADGAWSVSATPTCLPAWTIAVSVSNGVISGSGATGQVSRSGAVRGNVTVLGFSFDYIGRFRGRQASGTLSGANGCTGHWTAAKS